MELTVNLENLSESEREKLISLAEKSVNPKSKIWKPEDSKAYYFVSSNGIASKDFYTPTSLDRKRWEFGNCYKTEEEAEFERQHRLVEVELQRFAVEHNEGEIDWNDNNIRYAASYDYDKKKIVVTGFCSWCIGGTYFTSEEIAQSAIDTIGEERLKKYYFRVKD